MQLPRMSNGTLQLSASCEFCRNADAWRSSSQDPLAWRAGRWTLRSLRPLPLSRDFDFATQRFEPKRFGLPVSDGQFCVCFLARRSASVVTIFPTFQQGRKFNGASRIPKHRASGFRGAP